MGKKKADYRLNVFELRYDTGEVASYFSKGHHLANDLVNAICEEYETELFDTSTVKKEYGMWGFQGGDKQQVLYTYKEPGRGRFPITILDLD